MTERRKLKKSESLEIRIPYPTKEAFMARCRDEGVSASEALRGFIDGQLNDAAPKASRWSRRGLRLIGGAAVALAVGAVALPSLARPSLQTEYERLDANRDARVSLAELSSGATVDVGFKVGTPERLTLSATQDSSVAAAEARALLVKMQFARIDLNRDGAITFDEYRRHGEALTGR